MTYLFYLFYTYSKFFIKFCSIKGTDLARDLGKDFLDKQIDKFNKKNTAIFLGH